MLLETEEGLFVSVGSDHTDRIIEQSSFVASKRAFPKIVAPMVWPVSELVGQWDQLILRSWITGEGKRSLYQERSLGAILPPSDLLALVPAADRGHGLILFSGTVPSLVPAPQTGWWRFEGDLCAEDGAILARCEYDYEAGPRPRRP